MKEPRLLLVLLLALGLSLGGCAKRSGIGTDSLGGPDPIIDQSLDYTVKSGDDWVDIAELFFADPDQAVRIATANGAPASTAPAVGSVVQVPVRKSEADVVRRLASARDPYNVGASLMQQGGRAEEAKEAFEEALDIAPEFVDARYNLGLALLELGNPGRAVRELGPVVEARPQDPDALYALGAAYYHRGDFQSAADRLEQAIALSPRFLRARFTYAMSLERLGQLDLARQAWMDYLELDGTSAWAAEARTHLQQLP